MFLVLKTLHDGYAFMDPRYRRKGELVQVHCSCGATRQLHTWKYNRVKGNAFFDMNTYIYPGDPAYLHPPAIVAKEKLHDQQDKVRADLYQGETDPAETRTVYQPYSAGFREWKGSLFTQAEPTRQIGVRLVRASCRRVGP
jgi:hypothetical protein